MANQFQSDLTGASPYLLPFLMSGGKEKRKTTAGKLPTKINRDVFSGIQKTQPDAFTHLDSLNSAIQSARANGDTMYQIRLQKKQQAAAELLYKKQQAAYLKKIQQMVDASNAKTSPMPGPVSPRGPGGGGGISPPSPGNGNSGSGQTVLPPIVASGQDKRNADMNQWACDKYGQCPPGYSPRTHIQAPEKKDCSLFDKIMGRC